MTQKTHEIIRGVTELTPDAAIELLGISGEQWDELPSSVCRALCQKLYVAPELDRLVDAKQQGQAQFDSIREMVEELQAADADAWRDGPTPSGDYSERCESARQRIEEDALSVEVRSGWCNPNNLGGDGMSPAEYRILLCTGGPAVQIVGELSEHGEPETAVMQVQDWFRPWTDMRPIVDKALHSSDPGNAGDAEPILLEYARCFYFGE